jgi:hypothetical protein
MPGGKLTHSHMPISRYRIQCIGPVIQIAVGRTGDASVPRRHRVKRASDRGELSSPGTPVASRTFEGSYIRKGQKMSAA